MMLWLLLKSLLHFKSTIYWFRLLDWKWLLKTHNVGYNSWLWKKGIHKAQKVCQGFKDSGSLSLTWLIVSFNPFLLPVFFDLFFLTITFAFDLGMPFSIWVSWVLLHFEHWNVICPYYGDVILVRIFLWKKICLGLKGDHKEYIHFRM